MRGLTRMPSQHARDEARLEIEIKAAHKRTRHTCGPERLTGGPRSAWHQSGYLPDQKDKKEAWDTLQTDKEVQSHHKFKAYTPCCR